MYWLTTTKSCTNVWESAFCGVLSARIKNVARWYLKPIIVHSHALVRGLHTYIHTYVCHRMYSCRIWPYRSLSKRWSRVFWSWWRFVADRTFRPRNYAWTFTFVIANPPVDTYRNPTSTEAHQAIESKQPAATPTWSHLSTVASEVLSRGAVRAWVLRAWNLKLKHFPTCRNWRTPLTGTGTTAAAAASLASDRLHLARQRKFAIEIKRILFFAFTVPLCTGVLFTPETHPHRDVHRCALAPSWHRLVVWTV